MKNFTDLIAFQTIPAMTLGVVLIILLILWSTFTIKNKRYNSLYGWSFASIIIAVVALFTGFREIDQLLCPLYIGLASIACTKQLMLKNGKAEYFDASFVIILMNGSQLFIWYENIIITALCLLLLLFTTATSMQFSISMYTYKVFGNE